jgi:hypothetical protein
MCGEANLSEARDRAGLNFNPVNRDEVRTRSLPGFDGSFPIHEFGFGDGLKFPVLGFREIDRFLLVGCPKMSGNHSYVL